MERFKTIFIEHIQKHAIIYLFMIILFITGIVFGAVIVNSMNFVQKQDLFFYLERFFNHAVTEQGIERSAILKESFFYHLKYLALFFLLGLSVVGLPVVWVLLFIKGLVVGFSVGFLVNQLGSEGLIFASLSIAPHNLIVIPVYIFGGSIAMIFTLALLKKIMSRRSAHSLWHPFVNYSAIFSLLIVFSIGAAFMEAYVTSNAMEYLIKSFYL